MRRSVIILAIVAVLFGLVGPMPASAGERVVNGFVTTPVTIYARADRCRAGLSPENQGITGWAIRDLTPGRMFTLKAVDSSGARDFEIAFYPSLAACQDNAVALPHANRAGDEEGIVPDGATIALVTLYTGAAGAFTYREFDFTPTVRETGPKPLTVVAVIDGGFSPYHYDFLGSQHPFNRDADPTNDVDFNADPAGYITGYPGATPLHATLPTSPDQDIEKFYYEAETPDKASWDAFKQSTATDVKMYRFPGTKIIGAVNFDPNPWYAYCNTVTEQLGCGNDAHGIRSAASAGGNIHGTCAECVFVLINGSEPEALAWAASQPWIDVITNSYGHSVVGEKARGAIRDNIYFESPVAATKAASERGQTIVFSSGNGLANAFDVPMLTYWSSEKGPDWMVTVGAFDPRGDQTFSGAGKPVDISSYGSTYPSTGGTTANGVGTHSGTSNAAPTVAGTIASVIQRSRELLGDTNEGQRPGGVVAQGTPVPCGSANAGCPLGDGVLTRAEAQDTVYRNVLPTKVAAPSPTDATVWPSTQFAYYYQGHGAVVGRMNHARWLIEQKRFSDFLVGNVAALPRPAGEQNWMVVDSKCRQRLWGTWNGGYYTGADPTLTPAGDPIASAFNSACSQAPQDAFVSTVGPPVNAVEAEYDKLDAAVWAALIKAETELNNLLDVAWAQAEPVFVEVDKLIALLDAQLVAAIDEVDRLLTEIEGQAITVIEEAEKAVNNAVGSLPKP